MDNNNEPKKHLTSAERHALYEAHAAASASKNRKAGNRQKLRRVLLIAVAALLLIGIAAGLIWLNAKVWKPARTYETAEGLLSEGKYMDAYRVFLSLGGYQDSAKRAGDCILENAKALTGRENAVVSDQSRMPWFSIDEAGTLSFDKDLYRGDGHLLIPDVFENRAVLTLKEKSFFYADFLLSAEIPGTVQNIGDRAFFSCTNLKELVLPDSVVYVGPSAFAQCTSLEKITLSKGLRTLDNSAFLGCSALQEIRLPEGLEAIAPRTFNNCSSLSFVYLPSTLKSVGNYAFTGCDKIQKVQYNGIEETFSALCAGEAGAPLRECKNIQFGE